MGHNSIGHNSIMYKVVKNVLLKAHGFLGQFFGQLFGQSNAPAELPDYIDFGRLGKFSTGYQGTGSLINNIAIWMMGLAGFVAGIMIVVNGIKLMTASGDPNKIKEGIAGIKDAIIGFILALFAAGIVMMIDKML